MNSREAGEIIRGWAARNGGSISSAYVYETAPRMLGLTRRQVTNALQRSGMYPVRLSKVLSARVVWTLDKPNWWTPERTPGKRPGPVSVRCVCCRQRYPLPVEPDWESL